MQENVQSINSCISNRSNDQANESIAKINPSCKLPHTSLKNMTLNKSKMNKQNPKYSNIPPGYYDEDIIHDEQPRHKNVIRGLCVDMKKQTRSTYNSLSIENQRNTSSNPRQFSSVTSDSKNITLFTSKDKFHSNQNTNNTSLMTSTIKKSIKDKLRIDLSLIKDDYLGVGEENINLESQEYSPHFNVKIMDISKQTFVNKDILQQQQQQPKKSNRDSLKQQQYSKPNHHKYMIPETSENQSNKPKILSVFKNCPQDTKKPPRKIFMAAAKPSSNEKIDDDIMPEDITARKHTKNKLGLTISPGQPSTDSSNKPFRDEYKNINPLTSIPFLLSPPPFQSLKSTSQDLNGIMHPDIRGGQQRQIGINEIEPLPDSSYKSNSKNKIWDTPQYRHDQKQGVSNHIPIIAYKTNYPHENNNLPNQSTICSRPSKNIQYQTQLYQISTYKGNQIQENHQPYSIINLDSGNGLQYNTPYGNNTHHIYRQSNIDPYSNIPNNSILINMNDISQKQSLINDPCSSASPFAQHSYVNISDLINSDAKNHSRIQPVTFSKNCNQSRATSTDISKSIRHKIDLSDGFSNSTIDDSNIFMFQKSAQKNGTNPTNYYSLAQRSYIDSKNVSFIS